jgi:2-phosphosulfolactate phosphatase
MDSRNRVAYTIIVCMSPGLLGRRRSWTCSRATMFRGDGSVYDGLRMANLQPSMALPPEHQAHVFVHLLPRLIPHGSLRGGVAVVVDVLRATTVMVHALAAGCAEIIPCGEIDEAREIAASLPEGAALLAGERQGLPIPGFDLGNSPGDFTADVCKGKTLVMTTTNGTRAILASLDAERVYIASFGNLRATSTELSVQFLKKDHKHPVHIICAGTDGHISLEDSLLAGALAAQLVNVPAEHASSCFGNDEALMVVCQWNDVERFLERRTLTSLLSLGRGGRNLDGIGLAVDFDASSRVDHLPLVAMLEREPLRVVVV